MNASVFEVRNHVDVGRTPVDFAVVIEFVNEKVDPRAAGMNQRVVDCVNAALKRGGLPELDGPRNFEFREVDRPGVAPTVLLKDSRAWLTQPVQGGADGSGI